MSSSPGVVGGESGGIVSTAQEKVQEKAGEAKSAVSRVVSGRVETASSQAGSQLTEIGHALRQTGAQLRTEGKEQPAGVVEAVSDRTDQVARYLSQSSSEQLLDDFERFGRRRPWLAITGGLAVGFLAARLLKASSQQRFQDYRTRYPAGYPRHGQPQRSELPVVPATDQMGAQTTPRETSPVAGHG